MQLKEVGEFKLIDIIAKLTDAASPAVIKGIGDDAAVVRLDAKSSLLVTADTLTEGIHFQRAYTSPYLLGKKCISVNVSDIAAMGGTPLYYLVCLSAPPRTPLEFIKDLYRGMDRQAKLFFAVLLGGDTTSSAGGITISITLIGKAATESVVYRHGAKKGDLVYVTGCIGDSALGLLMLGSKKGIFRTSSLIKRHLDPVPRCAAGRKISQLKLAHSMIDISDGLIADLRHMLAASCAGAEIRLSALPLSASYKKHCPDFTNDFYYPALCGGEDYELLFTAHPKNRARVDALSRRMKMPITCIGRITEKASGLVILDADGKRFNLTKEGYAHF